MIRHAVTSRAFASQGYDPETQTLEIEYHSGAVYQHKGVSAHVYGAFLAASSLGAYLNAHIKPFHPAERMPDAVKLWVCGRTLDSTENGVVWEIMGIVKSENDASASCRTDRYFVAPMTLDVILPDETTEWPGCYYPLAGEDLLATMKPGAV